MLKLHGQALLERAVENLVAGLVVEIRYQDCVLLTQSRPAVGFEVEKVGQCRGGDDQRNQGNGRAAFMTFNLTDEVLSTRCGSWRLCAGLPPRRLCTA